MKEIQECHELRLDNHEWFPQGLLLIFRDSKGNETNLFIDKEKWDEGIGEGHREHSVYLMEHYGGPYR